MNKDNSGPAFPTQTYEYDGQCQIRNYQLGGISVRDYFAAKAMQALIAIYEPESEEGCMADTAESAYSYADEMLEARNRP
jgi:hypothetical protein